LEVSSRAEQIWRFCVRFALINRLAEELVIEDIHAKLYERNVPGGSGAELTMGWFGKVVLTQDNTILREQKTYSLQPGDGYEISLVLEMSSVAGAHCTRTVFGLLVDYYTLKPEGIERRAVPSDCLYMFQQTVDHKEWHEFRVLNEQTIGEISLRHEHDEKAQKAIAGLEKCLSEHTKHRPIPKP
jgi:hypothetical protein